MTPLDPQLRQFNNLIFIGFYQSVHTTLVAQAQAVWATAFLQHALAPAYLQTCMQWTRRNMAYQQLRRLGSPFPDLMLDALPYIDLLLGDVGLPCLRKRGWLSNVLGRYGPGDYRGLVEDWERARVREGGKVPG